MFVNVQDSKRDLLGGFLKAFTPLFSSFLIVLFFTGFGCSKGKETRSVAGENKPQQSQQGKKTQPSTPHSKIKTLTFQAVGDLNLSGSAGRILQWAGYDYPFEPIRELLQKGDVNFANLEAPIGVKGQPIEKRFVFQMPPKAYTGIKNAGFNLFSLANNHILDFGPESLLETIQILTDGESQFMGAGKDLWAARKPAIFVANQVKIGVLAYSLTLPKTFYADRNKPGTAFGHEHHIRADIRLLRPQVEMVVVSFHWGQEKSTDPKPYQQKLAHAAIDEGADMILGHHPHVVQGVEMYQGRPIFYSLGNYAFGSYSNHAQWGIFLKSNWLVSQLGEGVQLAGLEVIPLNVNNFQVDFSPEILTGQKAQGVLAELRKLSERFGTQFQIVGDRAQVILQESSPPEVLRESVSRSE